MDYFLEDDADEGRDEEVDGLAAVDCWDDDAIQAVIRTAVSRGINPSDLFNEPGALQRYGHGRHSVRLG